MSVGLETNDIIQVLSRLSKIPLPLKLQRRITEWTSSYGKIRLVLKHNRYYIESTSQAFLVPLLSDPVIAGCKVDRQDEMGEQVFGLEGLERGSAARKDFAIPGTEEARRAERGVENIRQMNGHSKERDDVIGAVIGLDRSELIWC